MRNIRQQFFLYPRDFLIVISLFIISIFVNYYQPALVNLVFQLVLLGIFYFSDKNYLWFAFLFVIISEPGSIFATIEYEKSKAFALIRESPLGTLFFWLMFIFVALLKALYHNKNRHQFFIKVPIIVMLIYFVLLLLVFGINKFPSLIRGTAPWLLIIIIPALFIKIEDYVRFFNIIFYFVFIVLVIQFYNLLTGSSLGEALGGFSLNTYSDLTGTDELLRPTAGITVPFLSLLGTTFFFSLTKKYFNKYFLYIIIGFSFFSILLTATRGWILASLFIIIFYFILQSSKYIKSLIGMTLPVILIILIFSFIPQLNTQFSLALSRFETILLIAQGDVTAGGTLARIDIRAPRVMKKFYESPLVGNGFGPEAAEYSDGHVGNQNLLMHTGVLGYALFILLWFNYFRKLNRLGKIIHSNNSYKNVHVPLILFLLGIIIIHSTSAQIFGLGFTAGGGFLVFFLFSFANFIYWEALSEEKKIRNSSNTFVWNKV